MCVRSSVGFPVVQNTRPCSTPVRCCEAPLRASHAEKAQLVPCAVRRRKTEQCKCTWVTFLKYNVRVWRHFGFKFRTVILASLKIEWWACRHYIFLNSSRVIKYIIYQAPAEALTVPWQLLANI